MNKEQIMQFKANYEAQLIKQLSTALQVDPKNITVNWSLEQVNFAIKLITKNNTNLYAFVATENNLSVSMKSYATYNDGFGLLENVAIEPTTTDLNTLLAIKNIVDSIIVDALGVDESSEAATEEVNE